MSGAAGSVLGKMTFPMECPWDPSAGMLPPETAFVLEQPHNPRTVSNAAPAPALSERTVPPSYI
jgi:hypothetical protein